MENRLKKNLQDYGILAKDDEEPTDEQRHLKLEFTRRLTAVKGKLQCDQRKKISYSFQ